MIHELRFNMARTLCDKPRGLRGEYRGKESDGRTTITLEAIVDEKAATEFSEWLTRHITKETVER